MSNTMQSRRSFLKWAFRSWWRVIAKVVSESISLEHMMRKHRLGDLNHNHERLAAWSALSLLFKHSVWHKINWMSTGLEHTSTKVRLNAISSRVKSCLWMCEIREGLTLAYGETFTSLGYRVQISTQVWRALSCEAERSRLTRSGYRSALVNSEKHLTTMKSVLLFGANEDMATSRRGAIRSTRNWSETCKNVSKSWLRWLTR